MLTRLRFCEPPPHDLVQVDQPLNVPSSQSMAHACMLQSRVSSECGQAAPPCVGWEVERLRCCVPPEPQDFVQVDHAFQLSTSQSFEHACSLHARVSAVCGQALPPELGCVTVRLRDWLPPPHDLVQVEYGVKLKTMQFSGHAWLLHACVSAECGHTLPPNVGAVVERLRFCEPPPHDLVHVDQAPNVAS